MNLLLQAFPDIGLEEKKFSVLPCMRGIVLFLTNIIQVGFWLDLQNRRDFFDEFAAANKFDPLVAKNWYSVPKERIIERKVLSQYSAIKL